VQAIHDAGLHEARNRDAATLNQHPPVTLVPKRLEDGSWIEAAGAGYRDHQDVAFRRGLRVSLGSTAHDQCSSGAIGEDAPAGIEAAIGIEDHPNRVLSLDLPDGQPGIIRGNGAGSDDHGVDKGSKAVEASDVGRSRHEVRMSTFGGDAAVEALSHLRDDQIGLQLKW
jgi:hypothetical protein